MPWLKWKLNWLNHSTSTGTWQPNQRLREVNVVKGEAGVGILDDAVVKMEAYLKNANRTLGDQGMADGEEERSWRMTEAVGGGERRRIWWLAV